MSEQQYKKLISGQWKGPVAAGLKLLLRFCAAAYGAGTTVRNALFDRGVKKVHRVPVPVISIGNLTTGGTGKTPIVAWFVQELQKQGQKPGIISRGYRADETGVNDEKRVLDRLCPRVPHEQDPDRVRAAEKLIREQQVTCLVLDDAFQHRRIDRQLDVVLIDASNPFGFDALLPAGLLREPPKSLCRADVVLITRSDTATHSQLQAIQEEIRSVGCEAEVFQTCFEATELLDGDNNRTEMKAVRNKRVCVMTGIGNPEAFITTCQSEGAIVVAEKIFPDHYHYRPTDLIEIQKQATQKNCDAILTTLKDLVKIHQSVDKLKAVLINTRFIDPLSEEALGRKIRQIFR